MSRYQHITSPHFTSPHLTWRWSSISCNNCLRSAGLVLATCCLSNRKTYTYCKVHASAPLHLISTAPCSASLLNPHFKSLHLHISLPLTCIASNLTLRVPLKGPLHTSNNTPPQKTRRDSHTYTSQYDVLTSHANTNTTTGHCPSTYIHLTRLKAFHQITSHPIASIFLSCLI